MKFGQQFDFHKIPEYYESYVDYEGLKESLKLQAARIQKKEMIKLSNMYWLDS